MMTTPQRQRRRAVVSAIVTIVFSVVATVSVGTVYVTSQIQKNNRKLCAVLVIATQPQPKPPDDPNAQPKTEYGQQLQAYQEAQAAAALRATQELLKLRREYKC